MKRIVLVMLLSAAVGAQARDRAELLALAAPSKLIEVDEPQATHSTTVDVRATQINRCPDEAGRIKLQDTPCNPVAPAPASAAASAADVVDLSSLPPRPLKEAPAQPRSVEARSLMDIAVSFGWKLALFCAVGYAIFRGIRAWRVSYALTAALADRQRTR